MAFHKNLITLSILAVVAPAVFADDTTTQQLDTLTSQAHPLVQTAADFAVADELALLPNLSATFSSEFKNQTLCNWTVHTEPFRRFSQCLGLCTLYPHASVAVRPVLFYRAKY